MVKILLLLGDVCPSITVGIVPLFAMPLLILYVCCHRRYMTVLFYLNNVEGGGETAFPVANNDTLDLSVSTTIDRF